MPDIEEFSLEMPHSVEAEQTVLGALLMDPSVFPVVLEYLKPESFYVVKHKHLFSIMLGLFGKGEGADLITVLNEAVTSGVFEDSSSGKAYLAQIMEDVPTLSNIDSYCRIVEEKYYLRSLAEAAKMIYSNCMESGEDAGLVLDSAEQMIYDIRRGKEITGLTKIEDVMVSTYRHLSEISGEDRDKFRGADSGYKDLDRVISGLNKSDLIVLAARPGMGKTSFAMNIARNVCEKSPDKAVVIFSLEMSKDQIATRLLASESRVASDKLVKGEIDDDVWPRLADGSRRLSALNMYLDDTAGINVIQMKAKLRRLSDVGLVIIDYLQLMNSTRRIDNRVNEISDITRQIKLMAKEFNVPVILLSQLSRAVESRTDKHPMLSDLRESGSIEQDADIVLFLYRDGYYNRDKVEDVNLAECVIAKNRHGETGSINLRWNGQYTLFLAEDRVTQVDHDG
ncbi:MAG: replicative DNA helicase [Oscillospiraceae bacterium]|nr:replicative DNA helicase [Oscillospiraceae bacterium]